MKQTFNRGFAGVLAVLFLGLATLGGLFGAYEFKQQQSALKQEQQAIEQLKQSYEDTLQNPQQQFGAQYEVAGIPYYLYGSGVGASDTSITLVSFKQPTSGYKLSMADFGSIGYLTLEPGNTTKQEIVSFSGVSQNGDNTATLTGVVRGLSPVSPFTASSTLQKSHGGGTAAQISNPPQFYQKYANKENSQTITGIWQFTSGANPGYTSVPVSYANTDFVAYKTLIDTAFGSTPIIKSAGGTGATHFPTGGFLYDSGAGTALSATSSPTVGWLTATTTTATSTFAGGLTVGKSVTVSGNQTITGNLTVGGSISGTIIVPALGTLGSGVDGNVDYVASATSTHDIYAQNLTVESGITLNMNGFRLFATGTVSVLGTIKNDGLPGVVGVSGTGVAGGAGGAAAGASIGTSTPGTAGGASNSGSTTGTNNVNSYGGTGGSGGSASSGAHTGTAPLPALGRIQDLVTATMLANFSTSTNSLFPFNGGTGGAGGDGGNGNSGGGGGGGSGGGVLGIYADTISIGAAGVIRTNGGRGGDGGTTNGCGGGGGGGGLLVLVYKTLLSNLGVTQAAGGAHGTMQGGCTGSTDGSAGTVITLKLQ